jgi:hypothetical protein
MLANYLKRPDTSNIYHYREKRSYPVLLEAAGAYWVGASDCPTNALTKRSISPKNGAFPYQKRQENQSAVGNLTAISPEFSGTLECKFSYGF